MTTIHKIKQTPKERLERVASYRLPPPRRVVKWNYLIAIALLVLIIAMLVVAFIGGEGAMAIMRAHAQSIKQLTLPFWQ